MRTHNGQERKFLYEGREIRVSKDLDFFNSLVQIFAIESKEASALFKNKIIGYGNIWKLAEDGEKDGEKIIKDIIQRRIIVPAINEFNITDIDVPKFYSEYCEGVSTTWHDVFEENVYAPIRNQSEAYNAKVAARAAEVGNNSDDSDRGGDLAVAGGMVGGLTFGVGLLLANAAMRVATDVVGGAAHMAANNVANSRDYAAVEEYLKAFFKNFRRNSGIQVLVVWLSGAYAGLLIDKGIINPEEKFLQGDDGRAEIFLNNFEHLTSDQQKDTFSELVLVTPYNKELYKVMYAKFGDKTGELRRIAEYFGVDLSEPGEFYGEEADEEDVRDFLEEIKYDQYYPAAEKAQTMKKLLKIPLSKYPILASVEKKDPKRMLSTAIFLGWLGIDRFRLGYTILGLLKLFTIGCWCILWIWDCINIKELTKEYNFEKFMPELLQLEKRCAITHNAKEVK